MKKKILCLILTAIMIMSALPLSVLADGVSALTVDSTLPAVTVSSLHTNATSGYAEPDAAGYFYFDIALDKAPAVDGNIIVYYRTVDETAVADWGDYESVGVWEEEYVTLSKENQYKARVVVASQIMGDGFYGGGRNITRRFIFEAYRVEGGARKGDRSWTHCCIKALRYHEQTSTAQIPSSSNSVGRFRLRARADYQAYLEQAYRGDRVRIQAALKQFDSRWNSYTANVKYESYYIMNDSFPSISTPKINYKGVYSDSLNFSFNDTWRNYAQSEWCDIGISMEGLCIGQTKDSDGPATFNIYYNYQGEKKLAMSLHLEGEFDDSQFIGWEHAYEYAIEGNDSDDLYGNDRADHIKDNFIGYTIYDNDGKVAYEIRKADGDGESADIVKKLKNSIVDGYAVEMFEGNPDSTMVNRSSFTSYYLRLPSNFALADSYSYTFISDSTHTSEVRWLQDVKFAFALIGGDEPMMAKDDNGKYMVSTNIETAIDGDPLRVTVRFDKPVYFAGGSNYYITAKINGQYPVKLAIDQDRANSNSYLAADTWQFVGNLPDEAKNIVINNLQGVEIVDEQNTGNIKGFFTNKKLNNKKIGDIFGLSRDMRTPVATISEKSVESWVKSRNLDIYATVEGNNSSRYNDYVTVYYHWSYSPELPTTYSSKVIFHTKNDGEIYKTIMGTGNGEMYLHMKAVSRYGKTSISDKLTGSYVEGGTYTPFGPYKFDNVAPVISKDNMSIEGSLKEPVVKVRVPDDQSGVQSMTLYYVIEDPITGNKTNKAIKSFTYRNEFTDDDRSFEHTIPHTAVGVGLDGKKEEKKIDFYWVLVDRIGNVSDPTGHFSIVYDTNEYIGNKVITSVGAVDYTKDDGFAKYENATEKIDDKTFIYNYKLNEGNTVNTDGSKNVYYGFSFNINGTELIDDKKEYYGALISYNGTPLEEGSYTIEYRNVLTTEAEGVTTETAWKVCVWFNNPVESGYYDITLVRTVGDSEQQSQAYRVYVTNGENDDTATKNKVEHGTLLDNSIYQLSAVFPYFYKDANGAIQKIDYNNTKQPASFSSITKAKEYVYYMELADIYLIEINGPIADAINTGTGGYLKANRETMTAQAGQFWIRYKSETWTPTSGDTAWVYYYYGTSGELSEGGLSLNLLTAINTIANRIVSYGKEVILTDSSLFMGTVTTDKMLDENGRPYLVAGQIHSENESTELTMCGNRWQTAVYFTADRNIYRSLIHVGEAGSQNYKEYPIVGDFDIPTTSRFQYMTYGEYSQSGEWIPLEIGEGQSFIDVLRASGVYYIRELSKEGVSVFSIYIDKDAPKATFYNTDPLGNLKEIPVDGVDVIDITVKELFIGSIAATEYDRLSYVAVYKVSDLSLVAVYTADMLDEAPIRLNDGNYYIVVSDRSGNHYTATAKISSSSLECSIKETADRHIRLTCNRRKDQILRYEVYLNNDLITSTYATEQTFDKAGQYTIYIQDIYGNVFTEEHLFTRNYPTVTWRYKGADGNFHNYDPNSTELNGFVLNWISDNNYKISTSVDTRFVISANYDFEFIGSAPKYTVSTGVETIVTIDKGQSFNLRVFYRNHKDCYTIYSGVVDVTPPTINVFAELDILRNGEDDFFDRWAANGKLGDVIELEELYYVLTERARRNVVRGDVISSDIIKINVSDANEMSLVEVYLNGELIRTQNAESGFSQILVSRWGEYKIIAKDTLGNVSEFIFTNGTPDLMDYFVDGDKMELELHGYLNFENIDNKQIYSKVDYGNSDFKLDVKKNADVFISVAFSDGEAEIYGFRVSDGKVYLLKYVIVEEDNGKLSVSLEVGGLLVDTTAEGFTCNKEYLLNANGAHPIYASVDKDNVVSFRAYAPADSSKILSINARVTVDDNNITFFSTELSKRPSSIIFNDINGNRLESDPTITDIRANSGFIIDESFFKSERVSGVSLYYSKLNDLDINNLEDTVDIYASGVAYTDEGFYVLAVRNLYGNDNIYKISISRSFGITSSVTFGDGHKIHYSKDYDRQLYSNNEISLDILDSDVSYVALKGGEIYNGFITKREEGITYIVFSQEGTYTVKLTDSYGNDVVKILEINKSSCTVDDKLLTGYNEDALRRDEGYTNQKLTVDKTILDSNDIYYLAIKYGEKLTVLSDAFAEVPVETNAQDLVDIIGRDGDGVYSVICRNRYGAMVTTDIHYRGTPTLKLERTTRANTESEIYDLNYALSLGFWSNNTLTFTTEADTYRFTIDGNVSECPRTLMYETAGEYGNFDYDITYVDEYGFKYSFKAYLVRKSVEIEVPKDITGIDINGVINTKDNVYINFGENTYATYTRNNGEEVLYRSGEVLKQDGTYRFTVIDYAGNASTMTIKKDTSVEFAFIVSGTDTVIQNGGIVNSTNVALSILNNDSATVEMVLKDGAVQENYTSTKFTEDGKWELILSDKLGNKSYFCFYIVTRSQNGFAYTTPYEYRVTELWYDSGDGIKTSYLNFVTNNDFTSSFEFRENGKYNVVMTSEVTGNSTAFEFTVNTNAPDVSLVGCKVGETTINDVTIAGCKIGDRIKIYKTTGTSEVLSEEIAVTSIATKMPTITEGGKYRIVVESEAGVATELSFVRKHVMNTAGSIFIMVIIGVSVVGLFTGLIYRNKSKTDD